MPDSVKVEVRGIRELSAAFGRVDRELPKRLQANLRSVAENVAAHARSGVPVVSGNAAASIKARASTRGAGIAFGGTKAEYFFWLNFGGRVGRNKSIVRDRGNPDYFIYKSISAVRGDTEKAVGDAILSVAREASFETRGL